MERYPLDETLPECENYYDAVRPAYSDEVIKTWLKAVEERGFTVEYALNKCKNVSFVEDVKDYLYLYQERV